MSLQEKFQYSTTVLEEAKARIKDCMNRFDKVVVSFSGGKDSTVVLNLAIEVAKQMNKLPVEVIFIDEEALTYHASDYVSRVSEREEVDFKWFCIPIKHRNACSNNEPFWYPWEPAKIDVWCRKLPEKGITFHPRFSPGQTMPQFSDELYQDYPGNVCFLTGIRAQESLRRYRAIMRKKADNYIAHRYGNTYIAHPIYDWKSEDIWHAIHKFKWDYNSYYDELDKVPGYHNRFLKQRVSNAFGEEPLRGIDSYQVLDPPLWEKMQDRVRGARTALRYSNTTLYINKGLPPAFQTWKEYFDIIMTGYDEPYKSLVQRGINTSIKLHFKKTKDAVPDNQPHPDTGCSWRFLCTCAIRGDLKARKAQTMGTLRPVKNVEEAVR